MSKYLRKFETEAEYSAATIYRPSVSIILDNMEDVKFDPIPPAPPVFEGKYKLTLSDSTTVSAACDGTSAITQAEISAYTASLTSAEIGDCVTSINTSAFRYCGGLTSCTIGTGVTSIGQNSFYDCESLTSIDLPSGVTRIDKSAFYNCVSLTSVTIPNSVTNIEYSAFRQCSSLTGVTIPSGVTSINNNTFNGCTSLTSITVNATTPPSLSSSAFTNTNNCPIYVPAASVEAYKTATNWSAYADRIQPIS